MIKILEYIEWIIYKDLSNRYSRSYRNFTIEVYVDKKE